MTRRSLLAAAFIAWLVHAPWPAGAQEDFYRNRTVQVVIGAKSGSLTIAAQLVARHIGRHIPGQPASVAQQMSGGAHLVATNYVYNVAPADGLTLLALNTQVAVAQLARMPAVRFDIARFEWLGSSGADGVLLGIRADLPYKTFADLKTAPQPLIVGATAPGSNSHDFPMLLREFAGANFKMLTGYASNTDALLALQRKEVDAWTAFATTVKQAADQGFVRLIARDRTPVPGVMHLPVDEDLATDPIGRSLMAMRAIPLTIGRAFAVRPGTPPERVAALRRALASTLQDAAFKAEARTAGIEFEHKPASRVIELFGELMNQKPEVLAVMGKYIKAGD